MIYRKWGDGCYLNQSSYGNPSIQIRIVFGISVNTLSFDFQCNKAIGLNTIPYHSLLSIIYFHWYAGTHKWPLISCDVIWSNQCTDHCLSKGHRYTTLVYGFCTIMERSSATFSLGCEQIRMVISIRGNAPFSNEPVAVLLVHWWTFVIGSFEKKRHYLWSKYRF